MISYFKVLQKRLDNLLKTILLKTNILPLFFTLGERIEDSIKKYGKLIFSKMLINIFM